MHTFREPLPCFNREFKNSLVHYRPSSELLQELTICRRISDKNILILSRTYSSEFHTQKVTLKEKPLQILLIYLSFNTRAVIGQFSETYSTLRPAKFKSLF